MEYIVSVGEPWDFEGSDGKNMIKGSILKVMSDKCVVFKSNNVQYFTQGSGDIFILNPRSEGYYFDLPFGKLRNIPISGGVLTIEYAENLSEQELKDNSTFVIIGGIREDN